MARGWESKDVESQKAAREQAPFGDVPVTPAERKRQQLELNRARILRELQAACHPRFRGQLEAELAFLDSELGKPPD
ncbi:MAG: hypothetical protein MUC42_11710 [Bryobacter sp.]|nr:hypothetical protein [Bryobacter sp.]